MGIVGLPEIMDKALEQRSDSEEETKRILVTELKARNYVPVSEEDEYLKALWKEFKKVSVWRKESVEEIYKGIPREEILWHPRVDETRCEGCSSCVDFCSQGVFAFSAGKSHVVKPLNCIVGKSSCREFCPDKAISFPTRAQLKNSLADLKSRHGIA